MLSEVERSGDFIKVRHPVVSVPTDFSHYEVVWVRVANTAGDANESYAERLTTKQRFPSWKTGLIVLLVGLSITGSVFEWVAFRGQ